MQGGQTLATERQDLCLVGGSASLRVDAGIRDFALQVTRQATDRDQGDRGKLCNDALDFRRLYIEPPVRILSLLQSTMCTSLGDAMPLFAGYKSRTKLVILVIAPHRAAS